MLICLLADNKESVDAGVFMARYNELVERRNNLLLSFEGQNKLAQSIYDDLGYSLTHSLALDHSLIYLLTHR
jgi:hypothetical protein